MPASHFHRKSISLNISQQPLCGSAPPSSPSSCCSIHPHFISPFPPPRPGSVGVKKGFSKQHNGWRSKKAGLIPRRPHTYSTALWPNKSRTREWQGARRCRAARREGIGKKEERAGITRPSWGSVKPRAPELQRPWAHRRAALPPTTTTLVLSPTCSVVKQSLPQRLRQLPAVLTLQECMVLGTGSAPQGGARAGAGSGS